MWWLIGIIAVIFLIGFVYQTWTEAMAPHRTRDIRDELRKLNKKEGK